MSVKVIPDELDLTVTLDRIAGAVNDSHSVNELFESGHRTKGQSAVTIHAVYRPGEVREMGEPWPQADRLQMTSALSVFTQ